MASSISVFAAGLKLKGDVDATNDVRIDGTMEGNISSERKVMIGASGKLKGNIKAQEVHVMGEMKGDLYAKGLAKVGQPANLTAASFLPKSKLNKEPISRPL